MDFFLFIRPFSRRRMRMKDEEKKKYFRDIILWQHEGLDIEKQHCLFINFGVNMKFKYTQIRRVIVIFSFSLKFPLTSSLSKKNSHIMISHAV